MPTWPLLLTNNEPIAQNVGPQSGLSASHRLGFWFVAQLQSLTHTMNDGIKLIVIIEHVMGYKKYVVSHALQCCHSGGIVVKHGARSMDNLSLKFDNHSLHCYWIYDYDIAVTDFLTCDFPS